MALGDLQGIFQAIQNAQARRLEATRIANEQAYQQANVEARKQEIDIQKKRAEDEHAHLMATIDVLTKGAKLQHLENLQNITKGILSGVPVPGDVTKPVTSILPGGGTTTLPYNIHTINDEQGNPIAQVTLPTPELYAQQQAQREATLQEPAIQGKIREAQALQASEMQRMIVIQQMLAERDERHWQANELIGHGHDAARLGVADIMAAVRAGNQPEPLEQDEINKYVENGINGTMTGDELRKAIPNKRDYQRVMTGITSTGSVPIDQKQKELIGAFAPAVNLLPQFQQIQDQINELGASRFNPFDPKAQAVKRQIAQIKEKLIDSMQAFGQQGRLSDPRVKAITEAFDPSIFPNASLGNAVAEQNFRSFLHDMVDKKFSNLSPAQRNVIKDRLFGNQEPAAAPSTTPASASSPNNPTPGNRPPLNSFYGVTQ